MESTKEEHKRKGGVENRTGEARLMKKGGRANKTGTRKGEEERRGKNRKGPKKKRDGGPATRPQCSSHLTLTSLAATHE